MRLPIAEVSQWTRTQHIRYAELFAAFRSATSMMRARPTAASRQRHLSAPRNPQAQFASPARGCCRQLSTPSVCVPGRTRRGPFSAVESSQLTRNASTWLKCGCRRARVVDSFFDRPRSPAGPVDPLAQRQGCVLVPHHEPICGGRLVEERGTKWKRFGP